MTEDNPTMEVHVVGDWSEFDHQAKQRDQRSATFSTEGGTGTSGSRSKVQQESDRLADSLRRQADEVEDETRTIRSRKGRKRRTEELSDEDLAGRIAEARASRRKEFDPFRDPLEDVADSWIRQAQANRTRLGEPPVQMAPRINEVRTAGEVSDRVATIRERWQALQASKQPTIQQPSISEGGGGGISEQISQAGRELALSMGNARTAADRIAEALSRQADSLGGLGGTVIITPPAAQTALANTPTPQQNESYRAADWQTTARRPPVTPSSPRGTTVSYEEARMDEVVNVEFEDTGPRTRVPGVAPQRVRSTRPGLPPPGGNGNGYASWTSAGSAPPIPPPGTQYVNIPPGGGPGLPPPPVPPVPPWVLPPPVPPGPGPAPGVVPPQIAPRVPATWQSPGTNLGFWGRFLTLAAVRTASQLGEAYRARNIDEQMAMGDPAKLAMADIQLRERVATAVPFGIGQLARLIRDPTGSDELSVRLPLEQAQIADARSLSLQQFASYQLRQRGETTIGGQLPGTRRQREEIEQQAITEREVARHETRTIAERDNERKRATMEDIERRRFEELHPAGDKFGLLVNTGAINQKFDTEIQATQQSYDRAGNVLKTQADAITQQIELRQKNRTRDLEWAISDSVSQINIEAYQSGLVSSGVGRFNREQLGLRAQQTQELAIARRSAPETVQAVQNRQAQQLQELEFVQTREKESLEIQRQGVVQSAQLSVAFRPFEAMVTSMTAATNAAVRAADPADKKRVQEEGNAHLAVAIAEEQRRRQVQFIEIEGGVNTTSAALSRLPLVARVAQEEAAGKRRLAELPKDVAQPVRDQVEQFNTQSLELVRQQYWDQRRLSRQEQGLRETVTGQLAQAYGPGADIMRRRAQVTQIAGEAELRAQQILTEDSGNREGADTERRIGINRLRATRAEYIQGFQAVEGSAFRTNLSSADSSRPEEVLKSIDKGIGNLTSKIGTLVAQE